MIWERRPGNGNRKFSCKSVGDRGKKTHFNAFYFICNPNDIIYKLYIECHIHLYIKIELSHGLPYFITSPNLTNKTHRETLTTNTNQLRIFHAHFFYVVFIVFLLSFSFFFVSSVTRTHTHKLGRTT